MNAKGNTALPANTQDLPFELLEKNRPQQQRSIKTYERILEAAAELLEEIGVERISTNLIAERAGITVPALYRYFPNKYALLYTLGARLMDRQNEILATWLQNRLTKYDAFTDEAEMFQLLKDTLEVTEQQTSGLAILRAMRALPLLQEARLKSHYAMSDWLNQQFKTMLGIEVPDTIILKVRLLMEVGTSVIEMALEDPEMPRDLALREGAKLQTLYGQDLLSQIKPS